ncbi:hypothetical protein [Deinococcus petrolearius]|uniref:hypothetical protein n=1 Tax=Deinococcus petrolearius TaxID=1751295 RepID=UPI0036D39533
MIKPIPLLLLAVFMTACNSAQTAPNSLRVRVSALSDNQTLNVIATVEGHDGQTLSEALVERQLWSVTYRLSQQ